MVILCTSLYAADQDELIQDAADVYCTASINQFLGRRPSDRDYRAVNKLGESMVDGGAAKLAGVEPQELMMQY